MSRQRVPITDGCQPFCVILPPAAYGLEADVCNFSVIGPNAVANRAIIQLADRRLQPQSR